jgi:alpha-tubulin suppressor-like RCC1 family protein
MRRFIISILVCVCLFISGCNRVKSIFIKLAKPQKAGALIFTKVSCGTSFNLALTKDGTLYAIGWNSSGQLGVGDFFDRGEWVPVLKNIKDVSAGNLHSLALSKSGELYGTGSNYYGQLGKKDKASVNRWVKIYKGVKAISAGEGHSLVVTKRGRLMVAGFNEHGQLGTGDKKNRNRWTRVLDGVKAVSAGIDHSLVLKRNGELFAAGSNEYGQFGIEKAKGSLTLVPVLKNVIDFDCHNSSASLAIQKGRDLFVTGWNWSSQLGVKDEEPKTDDWESMSWGEEELAHQYEWVRAMKKVVQVAAGRNHCLAMKKNGALWVAGENNFGQLGTGDCKNRDVWTQVILDDQQVNIVSAISAGFDNSLCITKGGRLWGVGDNYHFQLGVPDLKYSQHWIPVLDVKKIFK